MRIAVTVPTGHVGRHLVPMLIRAGVRPLVLLRNPDGLAPDIRSEVDVARVDLLDGDAVARAVSGVDSLYWVDPPPAGDNPLAEYNLAAASAARAVTEGGVDRVVFQSSVGAEKRHGVGEIDGLAATEVALNATGADVLHLRCGYFFTNLEYQLDEIRAGMLQVLLPVTQPWLGCRPGISPGWQPGACCQGSGEGRGSRPFTDRLIFHAASCPNYCPGFGEAPPRGGTDSRGNNARHLGELRDECSAD